jgi:hypothetical protein
MTGKEKQTDFLKVYLKPTLKTYGYLNKGQTWWEDKGDFFTLINLQNFSWNNKDSVDFCFNIGIVLKATMKDTEKKIPSVHDLTVHLRAGFFLPSDRQEYKFKNKAGYTITTVTDLVNFIAEIKSDFETHILRYLSNLKSLEDCIRCFGEVSFWGANLKRVVEENNLLEN